MYMHINMTEQLNTQGQSSIMGGCKKTNQVALHGMIKMQGRASGPGSMCHPIRRPEPLTPNPEPYPYSIVVFILVVNHGHFKSIIFISHLEQIPQMAPAQ
jgi:hypothetical protein